MSWPHRSEADAAYRSMALPGPWTPRQCTQLPVTPSPQLISCQSWENSHSFPIPLPFCTEVYVTIKEDLILTRGQLKMSGSSFWSRFEGEETGSREEGKWVKAESAQVSLNKISAPRILDSLPVDADEVLVLISEGHHHKSVLLLGWERGGN